MLCDVEPVAASPADITIYDDQFDLTTPRGALRGSGSELTVPRHDATLTVVLNAVNTPTVVRVSVDVYNVKQVTARLFVHTADTLPVMEVRVTHFRCVT